MAKQDFASMLGVLKQDLAAPTDDATGASAPQETQNAPQSGQEPAATPKVRREDERRSVGRAAATRKAAAKRPSKKTSAAKPAPQAEPTPAADTATGGTVDGGGVHWTDFEAKTARIRPDQRDDLFAMARKLQLAKKGAGERITDNTLIRVAIDLLLAKYPDIAGNTEDELRASVGLD